MGIKPGPHCWQATALATAPSLHLNSKDLLKLLQDIKVDVGVVHPLTPTPNPLTSNRLTLRQSLYVSLLN